jgi:hypothetical protein
MYKKYKIPAKLKKKQAANYKKSCDYNVSNTLHDNEVTFLVGVEKK